MSTRVEAKRRALERAIARYWYWGVKRASENNRARFERAVREVDEVGAVYVRALRDDPARRRASR